MDEHKLEQAIRLLMQIEDAAPPEQPEEEDYDDTESAYANGLACAAWDAGLLAQSVREILEAELGRTIKA